METLECSMSSRSEAGMLRNGTLCQGLVRALRLGKAGVLSRGSVRCVGQV
jgi:hypothetical protein